MKKITYFYNNGFEEDIEKYQKYQVSSLTHHHGFELPVQLPQFMEITFFVCTNRINLLNLKFRQASNCCKRVLEAAKFANATNKRIYDFAETWLSGVLTIANSVLMKGKSTIPLLFNGPEVLSSASDKAKLFAGSYSKNSNFDD